jgi:hypothetical protein
VEARHLVVDDGYANRVVTAGDITVKHVDLLTLIVALAPSLCLLARGCAPSPLASVAECRSKSPLRHAVVVAGHRCPLIFLCGALPRP